MKIINKILPLLMFPLIAQGGFSSPELKARFMAYGAYNVPDNTWCFGGEPVALNNIIYINCRDIEGSLMARWSNGRFEVLTRSGAELLLSRPLVSFNQVTWNEASEYSPQRSFTYVGGGLRSQKITNLGPMAAQPTDSFSPLTRDTFFFKNKWKETQLWIWKENKVTPFFNPGSGFIFSPQTGPFGEIALKTREVMTDERSGERIWHYDGQNWKKILENRDAQPSSRWKFFRHQLGVEGERVVVVANDGARDHLILINGSKIEVLASAGKDLLEFDYFTPKIRAGVIVVRGVDLKGRKVIFVHEGGKFRKLLGEGDLIDADKGPAQIHYHNKHAIFYGAPGLDEKGNVYLQATLSDPYDLNLTLGIGLIKFTKE